MVATWLNIAPAISGASTGGPARGAAPNTALTLCLRIRPTAMVLMNTATAGWPRSGR